MNMYFIVARSVFLFTMGIAVFLTRIECKSLAQLPVGNSKAHSIEEKGSSQILMQANLNYDTILVRLLILEIVQRDLILTADQIDKLQELVKYAIGGVPDRLAKLRDIFPPGQSFSPEEYEVRLRKYHAFQDELKRKQKDLMKKALATLTPRQYERLKQIEIQAHLIDTLTRTEIIKVLDISEAQRSKILALCDQIHKKELAKNPDLRNLNPKECREKLTIFWKFVDKANAETKQRILELLTTEQRKKLDDLQGRKMNLGAVYEAQRNMILNGYLEHRKYLKREGMSRDVIEHQDLSNDIKEN
jgi:hypothetical protein